MSEHPRLSPDEYRMLVEQAPLMVWRADREGRCDYFNPRWLDFRGRTLQEELGEGWTEGVHPEDLPANLDHYRHHVRNRLPFELQYRLRRHDGAWRWILERGIPLVGPDGACIGFLGSCIDVTERVGAREAEIRTLHGILPICMFCKKIRDDQGHWEVLESYLKARSKANFSHGVCPDCHPRHFAAMRGEAEIPGEVRRS